MTPLWRKAFDAIERPLTAGSETWVQSDTFMDLTAVTFRVQRRMLGEVQQATERWLHLWGWVSRGDVPADQPGRGARAPGARTAAMRPSSARCRR